MLKRMNLVMLKILSVAVSSNLMGLSCLSRICYYILLEERGEEAAAENQQKVISAKQNAKLTRPTRQSTL